MTDEVDSDNTILEYFNFCHNLDITKESDKELIQLCNIIKELDKNEMEVALKVYLKSRKKTLMIGGNNSQVVVKVDENTIKRKFPLMFRVLFSIYIVLGTFYVLNLFFENTFKTMDTLLKMNVASLEQEYTNVPSQVEEVKTLIQELDILGLGEYDLPNLGTLMFLDNEEALLQLPSPDMDDNNFSLDSVNYIKYIYDLTKSYYHSYEIKLPDFQKMNKFYNQITSLKDKYDPSKRSTIENVFAVLKGTDNIQKYYLILNRLLTSLTGLISAYNNKFNTIMIIYSNIADLLWGAWWRIVLIASIALYAERKFQMLLNKFEAREDKHLSIEEYKGLYISNNDIDFNDIGSFLEKTNTNVTEEEIEGFMNIIKTKLSPELLSKYKTEIIERIIRKIEAKERPNHRGGKTRRKPRHKLKRKTRNKTKKKKHLSQRKRKRKRKRMKKTRKK